MNIMTPTANSISNADPFIGTLISAVVGGTGSVLGGGSFSNGAQTGAFSYLFNCAAHECWRQGGIGAIKLAAGGASVAAGAAICPASFGAGCVVAAVGASDGVQGATMILDAVQGISSNGYNPIKSGVEELFPIWGATIYDGTSLALNVGTLGVKVPLIVGATDGINRMKSMFGVVVSKWDNSKIVLGTLYSAASNRKSIVVGAIHKAFGIEDNIKKARGNK